MHSRVSEAKFELGYRFFADEVNHHNQPDDEQNQADADWCKVLQFEHICKQVGYVSWTDKDQ